MNAMQPSSPFPELVRVLERLEIPWDSDREQQFIQFHEALYAWNEKKNLTRVPREQADVRHYAEGALALEFAQGSVWMDLGTGPGFPAMVLAILRPDAQIEAVDSNGKMLEFLRSVAPENLQVTQERIEEDPRREVADWITGRALAPLPIQLELSAALLKIGGRLTPFRTLNDEFEGKYLSSLGLRLDRVYQRELSDGVVRVFPCYKKVATTDPRFPRPWATIKQDPLTP